MFYTNLLFGICWFWKIFLLFLWGCPPLYPLIYNINPTYSTTLTYSNFFRFTSFSFRFLIYNLNMTFSPTLTYSGLFLFNTAYFSPMWYVRIKIRIGGVTCCSTCSGYLIQKTVFLGEGIDAPSFLFFLAFFFCSVFQFPLNSASSIDLLWSHLSKGTFNVNIHHPYDWTFVALNQRIYGSALLNHNFEPQCHICPD